MGLSATFFGGMEVCNSGCQEVFASPWSKIFGISVAWLGLAVYSVVLLEAITKWRQSQIGQFVSALAKWFVLLGAIWFTSLQAFVIHAFCPWCCTTHALAVIGVILLYLTQKPIAAQTIRVLQRRPWLSPTLAFIGLGCFAIVQLNASTRLSQLAYDGSPLPLVQDQGDRGGSALFKKITIHNGRFEINTKDFPVIGSRLAHNWIVGLLDPTCPHCRVLHRNLEAAVKQFGKREFAVVMLPVFRHSEARTIQQLLMAVWRHDRSDYYALSHMLRTGTLAARSSTLREAIEQRLGKATLDQVLAEQGSWINTQLELANQVRAFNKTVTGRDGVPQLIAGNTILQGSKQPDLLAAWIGAQFDLALPGASTNVLLAASTVQSMSKLIREDIVLPSRSATSVRTVKVGEPAKAPTVTLGTTTSRNPKSEINNLKSEIATPHSAIRNPHSEISQSAIHNPQSTIHNPQSDWRPPSLRAQEPEVAVANKRLVIPLTIAPTPLRKPSGRTVLANLGPDVTQDMLWVEMPEPLRAAGVTALVGARTATGKIPLSLRFPEGFQVPKPADASKVSVGKKGSTDPLVQLVLRD